MSESILRRVQRVVSAGVGEALDAAERFTGLGMTREAIRQVETEIAGVRRRQAAAEAGRSEAAEQQRAYRKEAAGMSDDARFALDKGRADLAQRAIARQLDLEDGARRAALSEASHAAEDARLAEEIKTLEGRKATLVAELAAATAREESGSTRIGVEDDIDRLRRDEDIARRLAALRGDAAPLKPKRGGKDKS